MISVPYIFGIAFHVCSFLFFLFLGVIYIRKNARYNLKNYIFRRILCFGVFGFLSEFLYLFVLYFSTSTTLVGLSKKFMFLCFLACLMLWSYYMVITAFEKNQSASNMIRKNNFNIDIFMLVSLGVVGILSLILPTVYEFSEVGSVLYLHGASITFLYVVYILVSLIPVPFLLMNYSDITFKGTFPYYFSLLLELISFVLIYFIPSFCIIGFVFTMNCYMIYFRMENPDLFLIRRFKKNSDRMRFFREKYGFLFNMSPELRDMLTEISIMKDNYLIDHKKTISKKKLETLIQDFITSGESGKTVHTKVDDDGVEILDLDDDSNEEEMLVTKEIYSLNEIKEILEEDNLPRW